MHTETTLNKRRRKEIIRYRLRDLLLRIQLIAIAVLLIKFVLVIGYAWIRGYGWHWEWFWGPLYIIVFSIEPQEFIDLHTTTLLVGYIAASIGELIAIITVWRRGRHQWIDIFYVAIVIETIQFITAVVWEVHDKETANPYWLYLIIPITFLFTIYYIKHFARDILAVTNNDEVL